MSVVLHVDCNSFYVSCEMSENPKLRGKAVVVGGDEEARHGIVLAKSDLAKKHGIKTALTLMEARRMCPNLIVLPPNFALYQRMTNESREIFLDYSGKVEPFGADEAWLDIGNETFSEGVKLADEIRRRMWNELGITASVGVAGDKVMAKLGSDFRKPDGTTLIQPEDIERMVWPLPAGELLYVGWATAAKLARFDINTIGDIARAKPTDLNLLLGVKGSMIWNYANGLDRSPVCVFGEGGGAEKSISHSMTMPYDLRCADDVQRGFFTLTEAVSERIRKSGYIARTLQIYLRDSRMKSVIRRRKFKKPTCLTSEIMSAAMELFHEHYNLTTREPIRALGVAGADLFPADGMMQMSMLPDDRRRERQETLERAIDGIRDRFGHFAIRRASLLFDRIGDTNVLDPTVHPVPFA